MKGFLQVRCWDWRDTRYVEVWRISDTADRKHALRRRVHLVATPQRSEMSEREAVEAILTALETALRAFPPL